MSKLITVRIIVNYILAKIEKQNDAKFGRD